MAKQQFANNLAVTLEGAVDATTTTFVLEAGDGAKLPTIGSNQFLKLTLAVGFPDAETDWEVVHVTNVSTDTLTVVRERDDTTGLIWPDATVLEARTTEGTFEGMMQKSGDQLENFSEKKVTPTVGATTDLDGDFGNVHTFTLDENTTLSFSNIPATGVVIFTAIIEQDGTGGWTVTLPASVTRGALDLALTASFQTIAVFVTTDGGTSWTVMTSFKET